MIEYCCLKKFKTDTSKQSIHSHPMAIGLIGVYDFDFILLCFLHAYIG